MQKKIYLATLLLCVISFSFGQYNIQLLGKKTYTGQNLSGSWGYNDTINNKEYALIGTTKGLSIVDITTPTTPVEVKFINGKQGTWRECQTYKNYAYITQDNDTTNSEGVLIYDLSQIPGGKVDTFKGTTVNDYIGRSHSLYIDEKGFLYLNGGDARVNGVRTNGVLIYDLKPNPKKPTYVGFTQNLFGTGAVNYVHDCYVRNDTMFQAHIYNNRFTIWDVRNRAVPVKLQDFATPYSTIHNMWLSDDSKTLFVTHEKSGFPGEAYDISDLNNIKQLCEFRIMPNNQEILHNVHVLNDYIIGSYYSDGVAVFDASDPTNVITVGYYDTQPTATNTYSGVWGAYGFYKSGLITVSDMVKGMHVLKPTYIRAARIQGTVTDTNTTQPIVSAAFSFVDTAITTSTSIDGFYKTGTVKPGLTRFKIQKTGYIPKYIDTVLTNGVTLNINVQLRQIPVTSSQNVRLCNSSSYRLPDGRIVSAAGTYTSNLVLPSGRDSIITTNLTLAYTTSSIQANICDGEAYTLPGGRNVTTGGTYIDTLLNLFRCDSFITTQLAVLPTYSFTKYDTINNGETYTLPNGNTTGTQGTYVNNLTTSSGCDSVVTVNLFVNNVSGISNTINDNALKFFVNQNQLMIENSGNTIITRLDIYNSIGVLVQSFVKPNNILVLQALPKDLYIIRATTGNNEQCIGKVVIY